MGSHPQNCGKFPSVSWEMTTLSSAVFHHCEKSSRPDHRCLICVIESMAFPWTWQLKWVDSHLLLGSIPNPYGELNGFLKENAWTQARITEWQVWGKDERIIVCEVESREQDLFFSFLGLIYYHLACLVPYPVLRGLMLLFCLAATLGCKASDGIARALTRGQNRELAAIFFSSVFLWPRFQIKALKGSASRSAGPIPRLQGLGSAWFQYVTLSHM